MTPCADTGPNPRFSAGQHVRLRYGDREVLARVVLAGPTGVSLFVTFEAIVDGHAGGMPILWENGAYRSIITQHEVTLAPDKMT